MSTLFALRRLLTYLGVQAIIAALYFLLKLGPIEASVLEFTWVDDYCTPHFLAPWVYLSFFVLLYMSILFADDKREIVDCGGGMLVNTIIASLVFFFYPTQIHYYHFDYHSYIGEGTCSAWVLQFIRDSDGTQNCFPSLHIANSSVAVYFLWRKGLLWKLLSSLWLFAIAWSVLSIKQHYFWDIIGGGVLAVISIQTMSYLLKSGALSFLLEKKS